MILEQRPGLWLDYPAEEVGPHWHYGYNIRWRDGRPETIGPVRELSCLEYSAPLWLDATRTLYPLLRRLVLVPTASKAYLVGAANDAVVQAELIDIADLQQPTRWAQWVDVTPAAWGSAPLGFAAVVPSAPNCPIGDPWVAVLDDGVVVGSVSNGGAGYLAHWASATPATIAAPVTPPAGVINGNCYDGAYTAQGHLMVCGRDRVAISDAGSLDFTLSTTSLAAGWLLGEHGTHYVGVMETSYGPLAWTDAGVDRFRISSSATKAYEREVLFRGAGLRASRAKAEVDGAVMWLGSDGTFWQWRGSGDPRPVPCPLIRSILGRVHERSLSYTSAAANHARGEIIWSFIIDRVAGIRWNIHLVYSVREDAWSIWLLDRQAWLDTQTQAGVIAADYAGKLWEHDLPLAHDFTLAARDPLDDWLNSGAPRRGIDVDSLVATPWRIETGGIHLPEVVGQSLDVFRVRVPTATRSGSQFGAAAGPPDMTIDVYASRGAQHQTQQRTIMGGESEADFRIAGETIKIALSGSDKAITRISPISIKARGSGERGA